MSSLETKLRRIVQSGERGRRGDVQKIERMLGDADWQTRRAAAAGIAAAVNGDRLAPEEESAVFQELIRMVGESRDAGRRAAASAALEAMGGRALPTIIARLVSETDDANLRVALTRIIGQIGGAETVHALAPLTSDWDANVAATAVAALGRARSCEATSILIAHTDDENDWLRFAAISALGELGDERAVARLEKLLDDSLTEEIAAASLADISSLEAVRALARRLFNRETNAVRAMILKAMISLVADERRLPRAVMEYLYAEARRLFRARASERTIDELIRLSESSDANLARAAIIALGWSGDGRRAFPVIRDAFASSAMRRAATLALTDFARDKGSCRALLAVASGDIAPGNITGVEMAHALGSARHAVAVEAAARLYASGTDEDAETCEAMASAMAQHCEWLRGDPKEIGDDAARRLIVRLRELRADEESFVKIAETLGLLARRATAPVVEELCERLPSGNGAMAVSSRLAFYDGCDARRATEEATHALRHPIAAIRLRAIEVLERSAAKNSEAGTDGIASLVAYLTDESAVVRRAVLRAIEHGAKSDDARRAVQTALADEDIWVRAEAIITLGTLFGDERAMRSFLHQEATGAPHPLMRVAAVRALAVHARTGEDWRTLARVARDDARPEARRAATLAFRDCPQPRTAIAASRAALSDNHWTVRRAAVETLASFGDEKPARKLLLDEATNNADAAVRGAAINALGQTSAPVSVTAIVTAILDALDESIETSEALIEDAFAALVNLARTRREEIELLIFRDAHISPRAAAIARFVLTTPPTSLD